jgi:hypothetical protein
VKASFYTSLLVITLEEYLPATSSARHADEKMIGIAGGEIDIM